VVDVTATVGQQVEKGDRLAVMEAMKMQQPVVAPFDGVVKDVRVAIGDKVAEGDVLLIVEAPSHE
jgi:biotin carboxyl carrier protein